MTSGEKGEKGGFLAGALTSYEIGRNPQYADAFAARTRDGRSKPLRASDVFLWAVTAAAWPLARALWRWTENPVRSGIVASLACRRMATLAEADLEVLHSMSEEFEGMARGILDHIAPEVALGEVGMRYLGQPDGAWRLSLLELAYASEMKSFLSHPHCRALVRVLSHQTERLALPRHASTLSLLGQACVLPLGGWPLLDTCTDLRKRHWQRSKRHLPLALFRRDAPPPLGRLERIVEFLCVPRVKLVLRHVLSVCYVLLFASLLLLRADVAPLDAVVNGPRRSEPLEWTTPLVLELLLFWWSLNLLLDRYSSHRRQATASRLAWRYSLLEVSALPLVLLALGLAWYPALPNLIARLTGQPIPDAPAFGFFGGRRAEEERSRA